jgi:hypothetical protein
MTMTTRSHAALLLLSCLAAASIAKAQEESPSYVLAVAGLPPAGTTVTSTESEESNSSVTMKAAGHEATGTINQKVVNTEVVTILAADRYRQEIKDSKTTAEIVFNGKQVSQPAPAVPLLNVPVIFAQKDGKWQPSSESGQPFTEAQQAAVQKLGTSDLWDVDVAIYGITPRKPGEKWQIDATKVRSFGGLTNMTGTFTGEFLKADKSGDTVIATIKLVFDLTGANDTTHKGHIKGEAMIERSVPDAVDLEAKLTGQMDLTGEVSPGAEMTISGPMTVVRTITVKKP